MPTIEILAPNLTRVTIDGVDFYFSYVTCIAIRMNGTLAMSENQWSKTTAKHMTEIASKDHPKMKYNDFLDLQKTFKFKDMNEL